MDWLNFWFLVIRKAWLSDEMVSGEHHKTD